MTDNKDIDDLRQQIALFRYGLIADLVRLEPGKHGLYEKLREKAERNYNIPGTLRTRVALDTMRGWIRDYRRGGFDALMPKVRSDAGNSRAIGQALADVLVDIKDTNRALSVEAVVAAARKRGALSDDHELSVSTVHRLLSRQGLMKPKTGAGDHKDRRRFAFEKACELWMSDAMHGPKVLTEGKRRRKTYLLALIDDATRIVPHAAFTLSENTAAFLPVLERGIARRGLPARLYVDNGSAFRSKHLALVCAKLGITLIHARPYSPQGKGKIERFFRTVRMQLLPTLGDPGLLTLDELNRRLWAWVEGEYHQRPHRGLDGDTPADRWAMASDNIRLPGEGVSDLFLFEDKRKVSSDRTLSLRGRVYEAEAELVGETVTLRFDPSRLGKTVQVIHNGERQRDAVLLDAYANCFVKRARNTHSPLQTSKSPEPPPTGLSLRKLKSRGDSKEQR